ncbi:cupin domain-containing protein [Mycolicibacterium peregrinum]
MHVCESGDAHHGDPDAVDRAGPSERAGKDVHLDGRQLPARDRAVPHRHGEAFVYAYVLEGSVRSAVDDNPVTTYRAGENWVEQPGAHHPVTENASDTDPAKLLVVFVSNTGDRLKVDDHQ